MQVSTNGWLSDKRQLYDALNLRQLESPGLALELPAQWVEGPWGPGERRQVSQDGIKVESRWNQGGIKVEWAEWVE